MARLTLNLSPPAGFVLQTVAVSHGWYDLPPFRWDREKKILHGGGWVGGVPARFAISHPLPETVVVDAESRGRWSRAKKEDLQQTVSQMLGLHLQTDDFYQMAGERYEWARQIGAGRMLRAASVFEDAVKMLATTNCSWGLTRQMIGRLVESVGEIAPDGTRIFPTPATMADLPLGFYESTMRAGYRARYFRDFAIQVAEGSVDPESWASFAGPTQELAKQMRAIRGFGRYTVENLCKLLGRYDGLGLDSWCLGKYPKIFGPVRGDVAKAIAKRYAPFGSWQGLALWLDLTKDWHDSADPVW